MVNDNHYQYILYLREVLYMRLEVYKPKNKEQYRILDAKGKIVREKDLPDFTDQELLYLYRTMLFSRIIDERALSYQRQGRMLTYAPNIGQEATQVASAYAMGDGDWMASSFRELGAWVVSGVHFRNNYLYWYCNTWGSTKLDGVKALEVSHSLSS